MGRAMGLFIYLVDRQTNPNGEVNFGRPFSYRQMIREIRNSPPEWALRRHISTLRDAKYISAEVSKKYEGLVITILNPQKWASQMSLFEPGAQAENTVKEVRAESVGLDGKNTAKGVRRNPHVRSDAFSTAKEGIKKRLKTEHSCPDDTQAKTQWREPPSTVPAAPGIPRVAGNDAFMFEEPKTTPDANSRLSTTHNKSRQTPESAPEHKPLATHPLHAIWQERHGKLPAILAITAKRLSKCRERMKCHASDPERFLAQFAKAVEHAGKNTFLSGSDGGWKASFDWFIANETNYLKVLEGNYDGSPGPKRSVQNAATETMRRGLALLGYRVSHS